VDRRRIFNREVVTPVVVCPELITYNEGRTRVASLGNISFAYTEYGPSLENRKLIGQPTLDEVYIVLLILLLRLHHVRLARMGAGN